MLKINRLKIVVVTVDGNYGVDEIFDKKVTFIASNENTQGKSSCLEAIYYCLGLEELIGGRKEKTLKPVFKKAVEYNGKEIAVIESNFYLEVENELGKVITINRSANKPNVDSNLVTVYYGDIKQIEQTFVKSDDMYLHSPGSATNLKGFHYYLEEFLGWSLPLVPSYEDNDRKLYLQVVFSAMFIEQKRGWSNILATLPTYFKIKEPKKRVIEFLLGLDSLKNEKLRIKYKETENYITNLWTNKLKLINRELYEINCKLYGVPTSPKILEDELIKKVSIYKINDEGKELKLGDYINNTKNKLNNYMQRNIKIGEINDELQNDLIKLQSLVSKYESELASTQDELIFKEGSINSLLNSLDIINNDIINNKDILKLKKMGSSADWFTSDNQCPVCHQEISDSLLPQKVDYEFMSIEENIKHLESQKLLLEYGLNTNKQELKRAQETVAYYKNKILSLTKIIKSIVNDIYSNDEELSEKVIREKIMIENELDKLFKVEQEIYKLLKDIKDLSIKWRELMENKNSLPDDKYSINDRKIIKDLRNSFVNNLNSFGYKSIIDKSIIQIDENSLLPSSDGFNMTFDSSASDNIRAIWAFTLALMKTSNQFGGNHSNLLIFDEPDQQSIITNDMKNFFKNIIDSQEKCQVIIGITIKDEETRKTIKSLDKDNSKIIMLDEKAIKPLN
ncbi:hypothetical protein [uncultured Metabacillus sp.]|uniref:hypothetical protein n=1 Tax=uncultured Metabacillus sp. TaxID=2860135 RepID=UPI002603F7B2|nr:hypothetical protein [uncultured Metabacillus sp.]